MKKILLIGPTLLLSLLLLVSLAGFFSAFDPYCELVSHFRLLNCLVATGLIVWLILLRAKKLLALSFLALLINLMPVVALNLPVNWIEPSSAHTSNNFLTQGNSLKVLQFNLWGGRNRQYKKVLETIAKADPDVIGFSEITDGWYTVLKTKLPDYPYSVCETASGGIAVFSKRPFKSKAIEYFGEKRRPRVVVELEQGGKNLTLMCVHPVIPIEAMVIVMVSCLCWLRRLARLVLKAR
jgi:endonuclease/exonuclease/phosphatase (EEP) superfamily protein YafD